MRLRTALFTLVGLGFAASSHAADFADPTWPCIQRKVENLSLGLMWPYAVDSQFAISDPDIAEAAHDLADAFALRRVALEDLEGQAARFAQSVNGDPELLGQVFARTFETLNKRRGRIISGIGDFSLSQIALAEQIETARVEMATQMDAETPDYDRVDKLEEQLDWDQLIHTDRQRSIQYLCETPVIIERRLFSIAQMLAQLVQDQG